jgi:hypothetical protein
MREWSEWASRNENRFDVALFKIWIRMELFLRDIFISYCINTSSERGYLPQTKIRFQNEEQLNAFLREGSRKYIEYLDKIEKLSKYIFDDNPFDALFLDATNKDTYEQIKAIRNHIAHESGESRLKYINKCLHGDESRYIDPHIFLLKREPTSHDTYYTYYINKIRIIAELIISAPT